MRAIIRCDTDLSEDKFLGILDKDGWIPSENLSEEIIETRKNDVLQWFNDRKQKQINETFMFIIYHNSTETWGVINRVTGKSFNIRFNNPSVDQIRNCCNEFVLSFDEYSYRNKKTQQNIDFNGIEVQDDDSANQFNGNVLHGSKRIIAWERRKNEMVLGVIAIMLFILCEILVSPISTIYLFSPESDWGQWIYKNIERLTPALLIISALSFLEFYWEILRIGRESPIKWDEYKARPSRHNANLHSGA